MIESKVAVRYAKSLLGLAQEHGALDAVNEDMLLVNHTINNSHDLSLLLKNPTVKTDKKVAIFTELFSGKVNKLSLSFLTLITQKKREAYLQAIAYQFNKQFKHVKGIETAVITTASGLDDNLRKQVIELVKKSSNKEQVELVENVDKNLIGGFILRVGDRQVDSSILKSLRKANKELQANVNIRLN